MELELVLASCFAVGLACLMLGIATGVSLMKTLNNQAGSDELLPPNAKSNDRSKLRAPEREKSYQLSTADGDRYRRAGDRAG